MPKYAVAIFSRDVVSDPVATKTKERMFLNFYRAKNENEALGMAINDKSRQDSTFPIIFTLAKMVS